MRRSVPLVLATLLAACTVTTTGAPCTSDLNCPSDQGCGNGGTCSTEALSCPGHTTAGECTPGTSCDGDRLLTCTPASGICSTGPVATDCPVHQACSSTGATAACACVPTSCGTSVTSYCGADGEVVTCAQDGAGCRFPASSAPCADPAATCVPSGGTATCACPATDACSQEGAVSCAAAGQAVLRCQPAAPGSTCLTWQAVTDCAATGLVCNAGACACPAPAGGIVHADADGGSAAGATPRPTGALLPASCRFASLTDALAAVAGGGTVRATGWTAALPAGGVVFDEPGGIDVPAGVTLETDDATPAPDHYAVTTAAALTRPLVRVGPGGTVSGFEVRNVASTGPGVETTCPLPSDGAAVTLEGVRVAAAATGAAGSRLSSGVRVSGHCPIAGSALTIDGAATGILVEPLDPAVESVIASVRITGSTQAAAAVVEGRLTLTGGTVDQNAAGVLVGVSGSGAPVLAATGTTFSGNAGDAVYVARGTLVSDACPYVGNGTHVHAQPVAGATVSVTVRNSSGAAKMTGATNSAFRLLAMGAGSSLTLSGNEIRLNGATQGFNVASGVRRGGGIVMTAPFAGTTAIRGNVLAGNAWDQMLVAASGPDSLSLGVDPLCGVSSNTFACLDSANSGVGMYSNGAMIDASWNHWTRQPAVYSIDVAGSGITGYDTSACAPATITCP